MPTRQITVCAQCGKESCDGARWVWVALREGSKMVDLATIPAENRGPDCSLTYGRKHLSALRGQPLGAEVTLYFPNWVRPAHLTVKKVEA